MRIIDEGEIGLKEKPKDTSYIAMRPEAPGVWAKDWIYRELQIRERA